ncbi:MAG: aminopeptidase P family protein [Planctomycetaceae bacterium]|nr:aminopeptidase P family protein [Planctomycetaceae bacterium]
MTAGVGGIRRQEALDKLVDMTEGVTPILKPEFEARIKRLQDALRASGVQAMYLHASTNLFYFTGLRWNPSERMVAAVIPAEGELFYIAPNFELDTLRDYWMFEAPIVGWHEHESPYESFHSAMLSRGISEGTVLVDEATPFYTVTGLSQANPEFKFELGQAVTQALRSIKTPAEIAIIQRAHEMTLAVLKSAASILEPGITTTEVEAFIDEAHRRVGAPAGSYFCIVLFGVATSFPHGVKDPQVLKANDWVLMDTGCVLHEYISDITRSFCFGEPTDEHRSAWAAEKRAQLAAFSAAGIGVSCEDSDAASRASLVESGFGPDYELPGLPHRTGHGCGLDIHEGPNLVRGEGTKMAVGMVFSNEPMLVVPDKFGVRLEDHFYLTEQGPSWFTQPSESIDDPFAS